MPIASVSAYIRGLLDSLPMPSSLPPMRSYITPPDPNTEATIPTAYVWPSEIDESRDSKTGGTIPRNTGPGTPSGSKPLAHDIDVFIVYMLPNDDPQADSLFPGIVDAAMAALRTSADNAIITDPWTGAQSQLFGVGEVMRGRIVVRAMADQAFNRYDCLLSCPVRELIQA